jgi:integrase
MKERTKTYTLARLRHHVVPLLGRKRVSEVDAGEIERFVMKVTAGKTASDEKLGPRKRIIVRGGEGAARKVARDLSAVYRFAIRRGIVDSNPVQKAAIRKTDNHRERYLSLEEIVRLGRAFDELATEGANAKAIAIVRLWALTGCRRDEIAGLKWSEVDFERGLLVLSESKTGKSIRPLGLAAIALLRQIKRSDNSDYVFPAETGAGHYLGVKRLWPKIVKKARLPGVTPHTLRHTVGSTAVSNGEALLMAGAILGHANPRSTAIYAHVQAAPSKKSANRVASKIAAALAGKVTAFR